ncbi:mucin-5AC-like [Oncorhynchus masou masou]|uniref:mucin-5AC-like n=1 Tax=Oncorhynchus masou masou TaxID=90313 RepID=UPI003183A75B
MHSVETQMAPSLRSARRDFTKLHACGAAAGDGLSPGWIRVREAGWFRRTRRRDGAEGMSANGLLYIGMVLLLLQCAQATEDETNYDSSGSSDVPNDTTASAHPIHPLAGLLLVDEEPLSVVQPDGRAVSEGVGLREQPAFSSILTLLADKHPLSLVRSKASPTITKDNNQTSLWPFVAPFSSSSSVEPSRDLSDSSETAMEELTVGTSRETGVNFHKDNDTRLSQTGNLTLADRPALTTSQVSPLTPREDTTTASLQLTTVTTTTIASTTTQPITESPTTTTTRRTTTTTDAPASRRTLSPPIPKTKPRGTTTPFPFTTTTEAPPRQCNVTEKIWVKTILTIHVRRNRLDSIQRQNLRRGLTQALSRALNDTTAQAQVETVFGSPNVTVGYHVIGADMVYPPSVVVEALHSDMLLRTAGIG